MKKVLAILLAVILTTANFKPVLHVCAATAEEDALQDPMIDYITECFCNKDNVLVLNKAGVDITANFFTNNQSFFVRGEYEKIKNYMYDNGVKIELLQEDNSEISTYVLTKTKTVSKRYVEMVEPHSIFSRFYVIYTIRGTFSYDVNSGEIKRLVKTEIGDIDFADKGAGMYARASVITINTPKIIDNGYRAKFSGSFRVEMSAEKDFYVITDTSDTFYAEVIGSSAN